MIMDTRLSSVIGKVQKLLALSKSSNPNEAANAAAAANKLIDEYRLSEMDLSTEEQELDPMVEDDGYVYETGRIIPWKSALVRNLAAHYGVAHFNDNHYPEGRKVSRYKLIGRTSDIHIVRYMFTWLSVECQRLADTNAKGSGRVFVASYCEGFVQGVANQLRASRQEAKATATSSAIIKLDARLQESQNFMYAQHDLRKSKGKSFAQRDYGAFAAGQQQGQNIHLGAAMSGGKTKLLGS
jgi:hypothetical protein